MDFSRCATCLEDYDDSAHRPCIGFCGHSLCLKCQTRIVSCPLCKRKNAFFGTVFNYQLLDACVALRQIMNESKSPSRSRSTGKRPTETPNISQQVVNATRRSRRNALESSVDKAQQREVETSWISQHIPPPESRRRDRSLRRMSVAPCNYRTIYAAVPQEMKVFILLLALIFILESVNAHFPIYSLYKDRKPMDVFRVISSARQAKRRSGGFLDLYELPIEDFYEK
ncbi:unnamed protein product [Caenorhabditis bovis]|uniref:RING-type domain-containing protein n=1 Tax=Caenorhabditis bovis TaxID=2654633 RepID=A0A8S1F8H0_9PELO|nr:unnamed protein product [Caenorhabditis bovis]